MLLVAVVCMQLTACRADAPLLPVLGKTVGVCVRQESSNAEYYASITESIRSKGYTVVMKDSQNDQSRQNEQVASLIAEKCDLLVIEPVMVSALEDLLAQAVQAQLPVVLIDRQPQQQVLDSYEKLYYVGCDSAQAGAAQSAGTNPRQRGGTPPSLLQAHCGKF